MEELDQEYTPSPTEIAQHYKASMDSVNLVNRLLSQESLSEDDLDTLDRNVRHLEGSKAQKYWTTEDLSPFESAITNGRSKMS